MNQQPVRSRVSGLRRNSIVVSILAILAVFAVSVATPQSASAATKTRFGCTSFGPGFQAGSVSVKDGALCVYVTGSGLLVNDAYAEFHMGVTTTCNWWIDFDTDAQQTAYRHTQGAFHNGCTKFSGIIHERPGTFVSNPGKVCATLFENAVVRARPCIKITS